MNSPQLFDGRIIEVSKADGELQTHASVAQDFLLGVKVQETLPPNRVASTPSSGPQSLKQKGSGKTVSSSSQRRPSLRLPLRKVRVPLEVALTMPRHMSQEFRS